MSTTLTGRTRYRVNWRGKVIVQVEYWERLLVSGISMSGSVVGQWRDATAMNLLAIERGEIQKVKPSYSPPPPPRCPKPGDPDYLASIDG